MESLGGNCGVEGRADGASGSCFWISIPYRPDDDVEDSRLSLRNVNCSMRSLNGITVRHLPPGDFSSEGTSTPGRESSQQIKSLITGFISQADPSNEEGVIEKFTPLASELPPLRILLVDDSNLIRKATSRSLIKDGHHVQLAQHGAECLKILEASRDESEPNGYGFDVILMDLQMPVMEGLEATRRIRAMEKDMTLVDIETGGWLGEDPSSPRGIVIIGVTANTEGDSRADCIKSGMDGFIEKPLKMHIFEDCLRSLDLFL